VRAFLDGLHERAAKRGLIDRWMSLLNVARAEALRAAAGQPIEKQQQALEQASVRHSLENLQTFPFIKERLDDRRLRLRGAYFDIADGKLLSLDPESGRFEAVA